jgi:SNF2 family DNA or RNA helicase
MVLKSVEAIALEPDQGTFAGKAGIIENPPVQVVQSNGQLLVSCQCGDDNDKLCGHEALVLTAILRREEYFVFFNTRFRHDKLKSLAINYGLESEENLDRYFKTEFRNHKVMFVPRLTNMIPVTTEDLGLLRSDFVIDLQPLIPQKLTQHEPYIFVFRRHRFYNYMLAELYSASRTKEGRIKNPLTNVQPANFIWEYDDPQQLKFFSAIVRFQNAQNENLSETDIQALKAIIRNPLSYEFYYHRDEGSENVSASSLVAVKVKVLKDGFSLTVKYNYPFYEITGSFDIEGSSFSLEEVGLKFNYFVHVNDTLYLIDSLQTIRVIAFLKKNKGFIRLHASRYKMFREQLLNPLEDRISISYPHVAQATPKQLKEGRFTEEQEKIIYLSDFGQHLMIIPVVRYGDVEIQIRTKRQIAAFDSSDKEFKVRRNKELEVSFIALILKQHPEFEEQMDEGLHYFYLHKRHFLNEDWFLPTFDDWRNHQITVLGFNEIKENKLNSNRINVDIKVLSGINWFNTQIDVKYGKSKAKLKQIQKSLRNKSKYVQLDDGTLGILPEEWITKFSAYFNSGDVDGDMLKIPRVNFSAIDMLFSDEMLDVDVKSDLQLYHTKLQNFDEIKDVEVPTDLNASLRPYQKQGLNWLNFLDDFNFGGCLADDMGLGKSVQIIAFILSQRTKVKHNTNLLVVPTSLIFNWKKEVEKFAPSIKIYTIYGADRVKTTNEFDDYEIVLTSYGTLLSDVDYLKHYEFNYIFLDESQNIRNPETQRYKTVSLLKSRNRIVITGTPFENSTFDIYGQFSFACPGLLGGKRYFADIYAIPIDKFKSSKHAAELQKKIKPFILRRTKEQVASELPDKTEVILYCEMKDEQRRIYDLYEKEFREYISATTSEELNKNSMNVLRGLTRLRQICDSPKLLGAEMRTAEASAKIDMLLEQIEGKASNHKMLVFSQFVSMLDLIRLELEARKIRYSYLTGSTRNREFVVNEFQENPYIRVFLISLKAGGTGLNLTAADSVFIIDPWWNPSVENQAIDRTHRIGQNKMIVASRLICPNTVEEKILQLQESKKERAHELISSGDAFFKSLSKDDLLRILA